MSMADAAITAWDSKITFVFWQPITAIREGDNDGNPKTVGDPTWSPLVTTPPYPDHTSGANNLTASATRSLALFFGTDEMNFSVTTTNPGLPYRTRATTRASRPYSRKLLAHAFTRGFIGALRMKQHASKVDKWLNGPTVISCGRLANNSGMS